MRQALGWIGCVAMAAALCGGCGAGNAPAPLEARITGFLPQAPVAAVGDPAWLVLGEGFGPHAARVDLRFVAMEGTPFEGGEAAVLVATGVIESPGQIRGVIPPTGVPSDHQGLVATRLELVLPDGRRAVSGEPLATFRPADPPPPIVDGLEPRTLLSGLAKAFQIRGAHFGPVGGRATLRLLATAGRPFPHDAGAALSLEVEIVSADMLAGVLPHAAVEERTTCVLDVRFPGGARCTTDEALAVVGPGERVPDPKGATGNGFGAAVAVDGATAVVGIPGDDEGAEDAGAVAVFLWDGRTWTEGGRLRAPSPAAHDGFGTSVAIRGGRIAVGSPLADDHALNQGAVDVFEGGGADWTHVARLTADDPARGDRIGASVALEGDRIAVGGPLENNAGGVDAGSVYVFARGGHGAWHQVAKLLPPGGNARDRLGHAIALGGAVLVAGAPGEDRDVPEGGGLHVFTRDATGAWSWDARLVPPTPVAHAALGTSVDQAGGWIAAGAPGAEGGTVETFTHQENAWIHAQTLRPGSSLPTPAFGQALALSDRLLLVGAPGVGVVHVFESRAGAWTELEPLRPSDPTPGFGHAVAISRDTAVVGSPSEGEGARRTSGERGRVPAPPPHERLRSRR